VAEVIVAFDVPGASDALRLADRLPGLRWAKLGPAVSLEGGAALVRAFKERGVRVFLDLKWYDIPNTVASAVRAASRMGVDLATMHALGGDDMMRAAVEVRGTVKLAAVTVLTSLTGEAYSRSVGRSPVDLHEEVERLARLAATAGADGVVTSPLEIDVARAVLPAGSWIVVPGIRPPGAGADDQRRIADPAWAVARGATHLVIGRPVTGADDPAAVYHAVCEAAV